MTDTPSVKIGIIGLGNMGNAHAENIDKGLIPGLELAAVADKDAARLGRWEGPEHFENGSALIQSGTVDAVLIATPHYSHTTLGIEALEAGLHVLVEKPISVHKADCQKLIEAWTNPNRSSLRCLTSARTLPSVNCARSSKPANWERSNA